MPKVTRLFESKHVKGRWYAEIDGGEALRVDLSLIADWSLYTGRELTAAELEELTAASSRMNARARALQLLGVRPMSRGELADRLREKGESEEDVAEALDYLESLGYLDDGQYAAMVARHYSKKGYGPGRIRQELYKRRVPKELWQEALSELPVDSAAIDAIIDRRLHGAKPDKKELKRLTDMLLRRGFSWGDVRKALESYEFYDFSEETDE